MCRLAAGGASEGFDGLLSVRHGPDKPLAPRPGPCTSGNGALLPCVLKCSKSKDAPSTFLEACWVILLVLRRAFWKLFDSYIEDVRFCLRTTNILYLC